MSCNLNGIVYDLREEGFNVLSLIDRPYLTLDEVREAVNEITFDDLIMTEIMESEIKGLFEIDHFIQKQSDREIFSYEIQLKKYKELYKAVWETEDSNPFALLSWIGKYLSKLLKIYIYLILLL